MSRMKKSRKTRRRNIKSRRQDSCRQTNTGTILPQIPASIENVPEFLIQAKNAYEAGNTEQTRQLLCEEAVRQIEKMPKGPSNILAVYMLASQFIKVAKRDITEQVTPTHPFWNKRPRFFLALAVLAVNIFFKKRHIKRKTWPDIALNKKFTRSV